MDRLFPLRQLFVGVGHTTSHMETYVLVAESEFISALLTEKRKDFLAELDRLGDLNDPDTVHDLRVAIRRLREALELLDRLHPDVGCRPVLKVIKRAARDLSRLRELDVSLELLQPLEDNIPSYDCFAFWGLEALEAHVRSLRKKARSEAMRAFKPKRVQQLRERIIPFNPDLETLTPEAVVRAQDELVKRYLEDVMALVPALGQQDPPLDQLHVLRISFKKLRYALELEGAELHRKRLKRLKRIQDGLGAHRDWTVVTQIAREYRKALKRKKRGKNIRVGLEAIEPYLLARTQQCLARMGPRLDKLELLDSKSL